MHTLISHVSIQTCRYFFKEASVKASALFFTLAESAKYGWMAECAKIGKYGYFSSAQFILLKHRNNESSYTAKRNWSITNNYTQFWK